MSIYVISYFLREEPHIHSHDCGCDDHNHEEECCGRDDSRLIGEIQSLGAWAHFMPESFLLHSSLTPKEILEKLKVFVNDDDLLFISKINSDSTESLTPQVKEWILKKENI